MAVRTARLATARPAAAGAFTVIYTCPVDKTAIVKDVRACFLSSTAQSLFLAVQSGATECNIMTASGTFPTVIASSMFVVLEPGDQLKVWQTLANGISWYVSGAELAGVAP